MNRNGEEEKLVISGVGGRFPECENMEQFKEALLNGVDLLTADDRRFPVGLWGTPDNIGKCLDIDKFDASFFGIHPKQANFMDPRHRMLLETVFEAIVDAGYNPEEIRGSSTGVYVGITSFTLLEEIKENETEGYFNTGYNPGMAANRVSRSFDLHGPSYSVESACSSSLTAFANAVNDLRSGEIEGAFVCSVNLIIDPFESLEFTHLKMLSPTGKCHVFSTNRDGFVQSEACVSYFIQKEKDCRRAYAIIEGAKINENGWTDEGILVPSSEFQVQLMKDFYTAAGINPDEVFYIEAHGTGTPLGDTHECAALVNMFCQNRDKPLFVGSVKSNMGHAEISSGVCSLAKIVIAMETGIIPADLHAESIDTEIPGIKERKLQVVTQNMHWDGGLVGVNSFGFGGTNVHAALRSYSKHKSKPCELPKNRLVVCSGRTTEAVNHFIEKLKTDPDSECLALIDEIHKFNVDGHMYRGYAVLGDTITTETSRFVKDRPIWFIYTGLGSQWLTMGKDLMHIEVFKNCLQRCAAALNPYGIDLIDVVTNPSPSIFDDVTNCFCAISAVEIAMTDVLYSLGIFPDGMAGHSLGEVGCSYADGQMTPEQAVLLAYARGYATENNKLIPGQMAAIGLSKEELLKILPEDIFIACQNGKKLMTISGPADSTKAFVQKVSSRGIFAKLVKTAGIAFHSKYVEEAGPLLLDFLKTVLKKPIPRSPKWISTSVSPSQRNEKWAGYICAEYHLNNYCNTVYFDQIYEHIPDNAVVIEVAPHGLLQAVLRREFGQGVTNISLGDRSCLDNERFFLTAIGKIYLAGGQPNLRKLYNDVEFPVSRGTKMISPMVKWDHRISWYTPLWKNTSAFGKVISVNVSSEKYSFLAGHEIDGRILMPATGYLELVWMVYAELHLKKHTELPVVIEKIQFKRASVLFHDEATKFRVNIMEKSGYFEIFEGGSVVVTGTIRMSKDIASEFSRDVPDAPENCYLTMNRKDFYKVCLLRRYRYKGLFQGITECDVHGTHGKIEWLGNFITFLDTMLHPCILTQNHRNLMLPTAITKLIIDPVEHLKLVNENTVIPVSNNKNLKIVKSGGIEIVGLEYSQAPLRKSTHDDPCLEICQFVHYESSTNRNFDLNTALRIALDIISQNASGLMKQIKICEFENSDADAILSRELAAISKNLVLVDIDICKRTTDEMNSSFDVFVVTKHSRTNPDQLVKCLNRNGFILYHGTDFEKQFNLQVIFQAKVDNNNIFLLRPPSEIPKNYAIVQVTNSNFDWLDQLQALSKTEESITVYIYSQAEEMSGIIGLMKCLQSELSSLTFRSIFVEESFDTFSIDDEFYRDQLKKDLSFNIFKEGGWGTMVYLPLNETKKKMVKNAAVDIQAIGDLSTLCWEQRPFPPTIYYKGAEIVNTYYSALNFKDVMVASGKLHHTVPKVPYDFNCFLGLEISGITTSGRRVMGMQCFGAMALQIQSDPGFLWDVPDSWSLKEAATVPCVYTTSYYALLVRGKLLPGESILIHAGTGGMGMAAIRIALSMGCKVFTTVGSREKRKFIKEAFPELDDKNIGNSRDNSFEKMIMNNTEGRGVDLVLNCLSGELFHASIRCIAIGGRFLEIGKVDFSKGTPIDSRVFLKNCTFHGILMDDLALFDSKLKKLLHSLVEEGLARGIVKPLPSTVFDETKVEDAFRFLASGKHKGKVLIEVRKENPITLKYPHKKIMAIPKIYFDPKKSYILVGGLGGVGLELTDWLISKGATKIILNSRRTISNGYQSYCLKKWSWFEDMVVDINTDDTASLEGATKLIVSAEKLGPVGGIFNVALVMKDAILSNQTKQNFEDVFRAKIVSGQNMDIVSRKHCKKLDHFVVFSSISCGRGNIGQMNYGMANSALERLCEKRRQENLPGLAVQWGPIADVGFAADAKIHNTVVEHVVPQDIVSCFNSLEKFMIESTIIGSSCIRADRTPTSAIRLARTPVECVAHIMGIKNIDMVDQSLSLAELGLDSLMHTEIKQTLYGKHNLEFDHEEIRELTLDHLITLEKERNVASTSPEEAGEINM